MNYWPRFLTYGNWGGPSWSGGEFVHDRSKVDWGVEPIDAMDAAFMRHDMQVQSGLGSVAHRILAAELEDLQPPESLWGKLYRLAALAVFRVLRHFG